MKVESASGTKAPPRLWERDPFGFPRSVIRVSTKIAGPLERFRKSERGELGEKEIGQGGRKETTGGDHQSTEGCRHCGRKKEISQFGRRCVTSAECISDHVFVYNCLAAEMRKKRRDARSHSQLANAKSQAVYIMKRRHQRCQREMK